MSVGHRGDLFPAQLHVVVRDWLSANSVLLKGSEGHVLIDSGHSRHAPLTLAPLGSQRGLADAPACVERAGLYREFTAPFFRMPAGAFAELLIGELENSGAVRHSGGWLMPVRGLNSIQ